MKTIKNSKDITTLEVGDKVVFGDLEYIVDDTFSTQYYLYCPTKYNGLIFETLNLKKRDFVEKLGIDANCNVDFPEVKSLEALTAIVSALFKEYEKQNKLPKTWEEFCKRNPVTPDEYWIETVYSRYCNSFRDRKRDKDQDKNICVSLQEAKAFTALMQLRQLRKAYVKDWEPDWTCSLIKFCIIVDANRIRVADSYFCQKSFSFPTQKLAEQFLTNFKDLLEIAKPLL